MDNAKTECLWNISRISCSVVDNDYLDSSYPHWSTASPATGRSKRTVLINNETKKTINSSLPLRAIILHTVHVRFDLKPFCFNQMKIKFGTWTYFVRCRFLLAASMIYSSGGYGIYRTLFQWENCSEAKVCPFATRQYILYAKSISDLRSYSHIDSSTIRFTRKPSRYTEWKSNAYTR
jgi:hypothetical protein